MLAWASHFNPLYTGGLFHCYMLDESICHFRGVGSVLLILLARLDKAQEELLYYPSVDVGIDIGGGICVSKMLKFLR